MSDSDFHMWRYWKEDNGYVRALEGYYPQTLHENAEVAQALAMIKNGQRVLDSIFEELAEREEDVS